MWESLLVGAVIGLFWPIGTFACNFMCYAMGIANIPGYLVWKADPAHKSVLSWGGMVLGWLGQSLVSLAFCALLVVIARWIPTKLNVASLLVWLLWAMAFLTALRPPFNVLVTALRMIPQDEDPANEANSVFAASTTPFTLVTTVMGFSLLAWLLTVPTSDVSTMDQRELADGIVMCMIVQHEPEEYPAEVREKIAVSLPALTTAFASCSPDQARQVEKDIRSFLEYENSQYDDCTRWYATLRQAVTKGDSAALAQAKSTTAVSERSRKLANTLSPQMRKYAEEMMKAADAVPAVIWAATPPGGTITLANVQAGEAAAAQFNDNRLRSYSKTYAKITGKGLPTK